MLAQLTLTNPRSEIIEFLINTPDVDPQRVIVLARKLTEALENRPAEVKNTKTTPAKGVARTRRAS